MKRAKYEKTLEKLQVRLCHLQRWVKEKGLRVVIVFEGRDGAGKGGTIRAITERVSPRVFRVVALPAPSDREKTQVYMQRYLQHFPAAGEVVIFDRSWYNRAGVEYVMGFCSKKEHDRFLELCPQIEKFMVDGGVILIKLWLEVSNDEQKRRFEARVEDPIRQWKLSPMDLPSRKRWYDYSRARDLMLKETDTRIAPWYIVRSDDKRAARLNTIEHVLSLIPYKKLPHKKVKLPKRSTKGAYDDDKAIARRRFVRERVSDANGGTIPLTPHLAALRRVSAHINPTGQVRNTAAAGRCPVIACTVSPVSRCRKCAASVPGGRSTRVVPHVPEPSGNERLSLARGTINRGTIARRVPEASWRAKATMWSGKDPSTSSGWYAPCNSRSACSRRKCRPHVVMNNLIRASTHESMSSETSRSTTSPASSRPIRGCNSSSSAWRVSKSTARRLSGSTRLKSQSSVP